MGAQAMVGGIRLARRRRAVGILLAVAYLATTLPFLLPYLWVLLGSFRPEIEVFRNLYPFNLHTLLPSQWRVNTRVR
jgi:ABC-type glycerol-3-phosphate transport system permease component